MSARGLSTTACRMRWRQTLAEWEWVRDRLPPRREWPAMFAAIALAIVLAFEVLRPDLVWSLIV